MGRPARKLPISRVVGSSPEFSLTDGNWKKIEVAYGCVLLITIRQSIVETTNKFLASEVFERNAKPLRPAVDLVESIKAASNNLRKKLSTAEGDAGAFAQSAIKEHFFSAHLRMKPYEQLFHALGDVMSSLSAACTQALAEMDDPDASVFRDGASWDDWIRALMKIANQNNLPIGASHYESRPGAFRQADSGLAEASAERGAKAHQHQIISGHLFRAAAH